MKRLFFILLLLISCSSICVNARTLSSKATNSYDIANNAVGVRLSILSYFIEYQRATDILLNKPAVANVGIGYYSPCYSLRASYNFILKEVNLDPCNMFFLVGPELSLGYDRYVAVINETNKRYVAVENAFTKSKEKPETSVPIAGSVGANIALYFDFKELPIRLSLSANPVICYPFAYSILDNAFNLINIGVYYKF